MEYKEFKSVLEAHVALAETPEFGTVYRIWDDGSSIYAVVRGDIDDACTEWCEAGDWSKGGKAIITVRYQSVGIDPGGYCLDGDDSGSVEVEVGDRLKGSDDEQINDIDVSTVSARRKKMTIISNNHGQEVEMSYGPEIADLVKAIESAAAKNEDGVIQAWDMAPLFPGQAELHTTTMEYSALLAAGCQEAVENA